MFLLVSCPLVFCGSALQAAARCRANAVYFEYDLDNDWQSAFFLCEKYKPESAQDDDWACDWIENFSGPDFPEASDIYRENHFDRTPIAKGSTLYLIARTVAAFGRCFEQAPSPAITTCPFLRTETIVVPYQVVGDVCSILFLEFSGGLFSRWV